MRPNDTFDLQEQWETYKVQNFSIIFQDVATESMLKTGDKDMHIAISEERGIPGVPDSIGSGFDMIFKQYFNKHGHGFPDKSFDFEFSVLFTTGENGKNWEWVLPT